MNDELIALIRKRRKSPPFRAGSVNIAGAIALGYCWIGWQNGRKS